MLRKRTVLLLLAVSVSYIFIKDSAIRFVWSSISFALVVQNNSIRVGLVYSYSVNLNE